MNILTALAIPFVGALTVSNLDEVAPTITSAATASVNENTGAGQVVYTATADDGTGPWLYALDLAERVPRRVSAGVEHYVSIAASAAVPGRPRRLVATVSNPVVQLWRV